MRLLIPPPPFQYDAGYLTRAFASIEQMSSFTVTRLEAVDGILLQAPNGTVWKLGVDNSGNVVTTSVPLGQAGSPPY
jgi:hypothetical protein